MKKLHRVLLAAFIGLSLAGCSGGKGSTTIPTTNGGTQSSPASKTQTTSLTMQIPQSVATQYKKTRTPQYVSASTLGVAVWVFVPPATQPVTPTAVADFSATSPACTAGSNGARTCTITIPAPIGTNDTFVVSTYDQVPANGLPQGNLLSTNTITGVSIVAGQVNTVPLTLNGVPATIVINPPAVAVPAGQPSSFTINVNAKDVDGNYIIGTGSYTNPINLAITGDPNTTLSLSSSTITAPSGSAITVNFDGGSLGTGTITATATGATTAHTTITASNAVSQVTFTIPGFSSEAVYVGSNNTSIISRYASNATGNATPTLQISGGAPLAIAVDATKEYILYSNLSIQIVPFGSTSLAGATVISGNLTGLCNPEQIAIYNGTIYVADTCGSILEWPSNTAGGNVAPSQRITGLGIAAKVAVAASGIYVGIAGSNGNVQVFSLGASGNATPTYVIPPGVTSFDAADGPQSIAVDGAGNVYVSSLGLFNNVSVFGPGSTTLSYEITGAGDFCTPEGIALDGLGNVWVANVCANITNPEAWKINGFAVGAGNATNAPVASTGGNPNSQFTLQPCCANIAIDSTNRIYSANTFANSVSQLNENGTLISTLVAGPTGQISAPSELTFDSAGNLYVANDDQGTISIFQPGQTVPLRQFWSHAQNHCNVRGVAVNAAGNVFVGDNCTNSIFEFPPNPSGSTTVLLAVSGGGSGLSSPMQIALDSAGNLYVANLGNNTITEYGNGLLANGTPTATIGGGSTQISQPTGVAVDAAGYIYVLNNNPGSVTVYAPGASGNAVPVRMITGITSHNGMLAVDPFQNIYVNEGGGFLVWGATANGAVAPNVVVNAGNSAAGIAISPTQP